MESDNQPYSPAHGPHTFVRKKAIPPGRVAEKPSQHSMLFPILAKNVECCDGLRSGQATTKGQALCSNGLIQLF